MSEVPVYWMAAAVASAATSNSHSSGVTQTPFVWSDACLVERWEVRGAGSELTRLPTPQCQVSAQCAGQNILLDMQGAVLALAVRQQNTHLSVKANLGPYQPPERQQLAICLGAVRGRDG